MENAFSNIAMNPGYTLRSDQRKKQWENYTCMIQWQHVSNKMHFPDSVSETLKCFKDKVIPLGMNSTDVRTTRLFYDYNIFAE